MRRALVVAACLPLPVGCYVGPHAAHFAPAHAPEGVEVEALMATASAARVRTVVKGELLEVRGEGLLVLGTLVEVRKDGQGKVAKRWHEKRHVFLVPFDCVQEARFAGMGSCCELRDRRTPTETVRDRLRLVSRFPQGLAPDLLRRILEAHGQPEVQRLGP